MPTSESVAEAAATGVRLTALTALRDTIARSIDGCDSLRDLAALSRQMTDVLAQIEALAPPQQKGDAVDEIAERRAARRASTSASPSRAKRQS